MRKISILIFLLATMIGCENDVNLNDIITRHEKDIIMENIKDFPNGTQFSIAIIKNNEVGFLGYRIINDSIYEIDNRDSIFEVGPVTQLFTSTILANLVSENTIRLNEPISHTLPFRLNPKEKNAKRITYQSLANNTSGLPNFPSNLDSVAEKHPLNPFCEYDNLLLKDYLENEMTLLLAPGQKYEYSYLAFSLLGYLSELKTGKSYEELLQEKVFQRYGMTNSTSIREEIKHSLVEGLNENGEKAPNWDFNILRSASGVLSSTNDLAKYILANFTNDPILHLQRQFTFGDHNNPNMALGWEMAWRCGFTPFFWYTKDGGTIGHTSSICMDTKAKSAVIILSNYTAFHRLAGNTVQLTRTLLRNQYSSGVINHESYCEAPIIEKALEKGWGTWINDSLSRIEDSEYDIFGVWQRQLSNRMNTKTFTPNYKTQSDFFGDEEIDVWGYYDLKGDTIIFKDMGGKSCDFAGFYRYIIHNDTLKFELIKDDECDGRVRGMEGNWIRVQSK
jgi:CubicO group peptidase (beta-lactamase class C family)